MTDAPPRDARRGAARLATALFVLLVVLPLVTVAFVASRQFAPEGTVLEIEMRPTGGSAAQLFWTTTWIFSEKESAAVPLHQRPGDYDRVRFPLPQYPLELLRFDFINGPGQADIRSMRVLDREGRTIRTIDPSILAMLSQIESIRRVPETGETRIVTTKDANDPMLLMRPEWLTKEPWWTSVRYVTPWSLAWIATAVAVIIATGLGFVGRDLTAGRFTMRDGLWIAALFCGVLAAKLALVDHYPMPVPFWDQWDGEAQTLYLPFAKGGLSWRVMFVLHNEHRIFFSRILATSLLAINGQWDPQLQILANAVLHSTTAVLLAAVAWISAGRRWLPAIVLIAGLVFAPPFALENTLAGFQSAFYFLVLFTILALWLLGTKPPGSRAWFLGWLCALCSIFTVAGGILTVGAIGALVVLRVAAEPRQWRAALITILVLAVVAGVSYAAMSPPLAYHAYLKAESTHAFVASFARNLAFPWINSPRRSIVWMPIAAVAVVVLIRRLRSTPLEQLSLALGVWVVMQCAATAYSRGVGGGAPQSRYLDSLSFGFVANSLAMLALLEWSSTRRWRTAMAGATAIWLAIGSFGIYQVSRQMIEKDGRSRSIWMQEYVRNVRHLIMSGDVATFGEKRGPMEVPYPNAPMLGGWLGHPYVRGILPAVIRAPLAVESAPGTDQAFTRTASPKDLLPVWDSYGATRAKNTGRFESLPTTCVTYPYLRFEVAGNLRDSSMHLTLKDTVTGAETSVKPPLGTGSGWIGTSVRCPSHPFTVVASDGSTTSWFAFRQPAEIGWASVLAERTIQQWRMLAIVTALLVVAAVPGTRRVPAAQPEASA